LTTKPPKEPLQQEATLYKPSLRLAGVRCWLTPADGPVAGVAVVPVGLDWLSLGPLTLVLHSGQRYDIVATRLDYTGGTQAARLTFRIHV
jgi:hypothetical protein